MSHDKSPLEQAADLALFGPLGLALAVKEALPGWVDLGRRQAVQRVEAARMVGEVASRYGRHLVAKTLVEMGILPGPPPPASSSNGDRADAAEAAPAVDEAPKAPAADDAALDSAALAIPGYDSLSAFQVVQRLAGLEPGELEAVRAYETAGRGRRTILAKIAQLQAGRS